MCIDLTSLSDGKQVWFLWNQSRAPRAAEVGTMCKLPLCRLSGAAVAETLAAQRLALASAPRLFTSVFSAAAARCT